MTGNLIIDCKRVESNPTEPVTGQEIKDHLIITSSDDDALLARMNIQCRKAIEDYCNISIVTKTITLIADLYKDWELPYGPVTGSLGVETRTGTDGSGPGQYSTLTSGWTTDGNEFLTFQPPKIGNFNPGAPFVGYFQWGPYATPSRPQSYVNRYKITYTAGYSPVPDGLKLAILNEIAYRYENRGGDPNLRASAFTQQGVCEPARILADPYNRMLWI
jgi:hypothetical protein